MSFYKDGFMMNNNYIDLLNILKQCYPEAKCSLNFSTPFELTIAVMLSAQCTDERVNIVTSSLFKKYNTPKDFVDMDLLKLQKLVHPCGFYVNKSKNIKACSQKLISDYNGIVPKNMEDLLTLPGIGRKSANVILLDAFGISEGIAVDTHCKRISNRIGLSKETEPEKIEQDLLRLFPKSVLKDVNHLFVWHGRYTCTARNPKCEQCHIKKYCITYMT
jgi:endonuclease-3